MDDLVPAAAPAATAAMDDVPTAAAIDVSPFHGPTFTPPDINIVDRTWTKIRQESVALALETMEYALCARRVAMAESQLHIAETKMEESRLKLEKYDMLNRLTEEVKFLQSDAYDPDDEILAKRLIEMDVLREILVSFGAASVGDTLEEILKSEKITYEDLKIEVNNRTEVLVDVKNRRAEKLETIEYDEGVLARRMELCKEKWVTFVSDADIAALKFMVQFIDRLKNLNLVFTIGKSANDNIGVEVRVLSKNTLPIVRKGFLYRLTSKGVFEILSKDEMESLGFRH